LIYEQQQQQPSLILLRHLEVRLPVSVSAFRSRGGGFGGGRLAAEKREQVNRATPHERCKKKGYWRRRRKRGQAVGCSWSGQFTLPTPGRRRKATPLGFLPWVLLPPLSMESWQRPPVKSRGAPESLRHQSEELHSAP
jgi:hypothetical protein